MAADILTSLATWSTSEGSNLPSGSTAISTNLDDNLRMIQSVVRYTMASDTIASATTTDLGTKESQFLTISGTTTIAGFGSISAGITKYVTFSDALTLTHNATSLILPGAASITTAAGDTARFLSLGSGNWRCMNYTRSNGQTVALSTTFFDGTVSLPGLAFTSDTDTGIYRIGANNIGVTLGGTKYLDASTTATTITYGTSTYAFGATLALTSSGNAAWTATNGTVSITSGPSKAITLRGGNGANASDINIYSGGSNGGSLGNINIVGATGGGGYGSRGDVNITAGSNSNALGFQKAGSVFITSGAHQTPDAASTGGDIVLNARGNTAGPGPAPGAIKFQITPVSTTYTVASFDGRRSTFVWDSSYGTPSITSGAGTGPTIVGTNHGFTVTFGTTPTATVVIAYSTWLGDSAPIVGAVIAMYQGASSLTVKATSTSSTGMTLVLSGTPTAGDKLHVISNFYG